MGALLSKLLFQPPTPPSYGNTPNYFWLYTSRQKKIPAFHIDRGAPLTVLFSHGNAEDLGLIYDWFREYSRALNVNVLAYDYTGYGLSMVEGERPSEADVFADIEAAFNYLTSILDVKPGSVVLYGRSLGSGPSCHLARLQSKRGEPVAGLILQSPLMSAFRVAFKFRFSLPGDAFCNIDKMRDIACPVFIIHGTRDEVVPFDHGQELYLAVRKQFRYNPFWVQNAGHNNIELLCREGDRFFHRIKSFLGFIVTRVTETKRSKSLDVPPLTNNSSSAANRTKNNGNGVSTKSNGQHS